MHVRHHHTSDDRALAIGMNVSLAVGVAMLLIKVSAWAVSGSSAILGDAAESVVHVIAVGFAAFSLRYARKPEDATHPYGHARITFFSAGFEGGLILIAAAVIVTEALSALISGPELQRLDLGLLLTAGAGAVNGALGIYLIRLGKRSGSLIVEANGRHVLTDCLTSAGVVLGLLAARITGFLIIDPIVAILVALNICVSGFRLVRTAARGLMDRVDPQMSETILKALAQETESRGIGFHDLRHRDVGDERLIEVHLLFPGSMKMEEAHRLATAVERGVSERIDGTVYITTHLEAYESHAEVHPEESE